MGVSRRVLAAAGALLLAVVGATSAAPRAGRPLRGIKTWAVYYGAAPEAAADLARFDVVVLDAHRHPPLEAVKRRGALVLVYLSLGEINVHHPSYGVIAAEPWVLDANPHWPEARRLDVRAPACEQWLHERATAALGPDVNGLFLDTADTPLELERGEPARFHGMAIALDRVVRRLRATHPRAIIVMNGGLPLAEALAPVLDGVALESIRTDYDFTTKQYRRRPPAAAEARAARLRGIAGLDLAVLTLEYAVPDDREWIDQVIAASRADRFVPYVATIDLGQVFGFTLGR